MCVVEAVYAHIKRGARAARAGILRGISHARQVQLDMPTKARVVLTFVILLVGLIVSLSLTIYSGKALVSKTANVTQPRRRLWTAVLTRVDVTRATAFNDTVVNITFTRHGAHVELDGMDVTYIGFSVPPLSTVISTVAGNLTTIDFWSKYAASVHLQRMLAVVVVRCTSEHPSKLTKSLAAPRGARRALMVVVYGTCVRSLHAELVVSKPSKHWVRHIASIGQVPQPRPCGKLHYRRLLYGEVGMRNTCPVPL